MTKKKILIATGGTGGHIFPALSLAKNLIKKNYDIILTTDKRGLKYISDINKINLKKITSSPLVKKNIFIDKVEISKHKSKVLCYNFII